MKPWYEELAGKYRYEDEMLQKLRVDWLDYMEAVGDRSTYNFLSLEAEDEKQTDSYREDHINASRKMFAIEEAFSAAIGKEATEELKRIRPLSIFLFSRSGEMAPEGFTYGATDQLREIEDKN